MSAITRPILLGAGAVRLLGAGLLVAGLVLPWLILLWRAAQPGSPTAAQIAPTFRPELVALPRGSFQMGSPEGWRGDDERQHEVTLTRPFILSRTEVTQGQFKAVMGEGALYRGGIDYRGVTDWRGPSCKAAGVSDELPAVCITWLEAVTYCNRLSELEDLAPAYRVEGERVHWDAMAEGYRLPTEAEWEYAARAGTQTVYVGTDDPGSVCRYGNVADWAAKRENLWPNTFGCRDGHSRLAPVSAKEANAWHLHGLGGNAAEWVWDWYGDYPETTVEDPVGPEGGSDRVFRGGSWRRGLNTARVADRDHGAMGFRSDDVGFRLARSCPSASLPSDCLQARP